jgi:hypothetical protein
MRRQNRAAYFILIPIAVFLWSIGWSICWIGTKTKKAQQKPKLAFRKNQQSFLPHPTQARISKKLE